MQFQFSVFPFEIKMQTIEILHFARALLRYNYMKEISVGNYTSVTRLKKKNLYQSGNFIFQFSLK